MSCASAPVGAAARPAACGELGDQAPGDARRQQRVAAGDDPDGLEQLLGRGVLEHEPAGPAAQRLEDVLVLVEGGHDQDPGQRILAAVEDDLGGFQPVHDRHPDIHQHDVGPQSAGLAHRLDAVRGLADDVQVGRGFDQDPEPGPDEGLVVGDQDPDLARAGARRDCSQRSGAHERRPSAGSRATTANPPSGRGPRRGPPPSIAARSRMPASPSPGQPGQPAAPGPVRRR